ncbi:MAG TPA: alpha-mannosidase [Fimbriimonadaceae bacterium]|nr:alpha-mannosidase [Fimbriimonadaceae bacterium]
MLKHPEITRRRLDLFLKQDIVPRLRGEHAPLKIEINQNPARDQNEAARGPWQEVQKGFRYGPAYTTFWFRLTGTVPESMAGKEIAVVADLGGERTVWRDNSPWCGIDWEHTDMGFLDGSIFPCEESKVGKIEMYVQSYTRNPQMEVHIRERPREQLVETVEKAEIVVVDRELKALHYDMEFAIGLLDALEKDGPSYATLLRALNEVVNLCRPESRETIARARKLIKDTLGALNGELKHTIVPVGHAHLDTAWLWPLEITKKKMAHTTATQLNLMDQYPEYVFAHSQASQYEWLEKEYPILFQRVKEAVDRGQWEPVGSMWVEADCNLTGAESLIRQFLYGRRYFREKFGYETHDMWLPDVFGYAAALPQILAKFNIKYFLTQKISWNQFNKFPHHTFWWQGIDGTRIWTHFPPADTYCGSCEPKEVLYSVKNYKDHARADHSLYLFGFGDGGGGPTERHLEMLRRGRMAPHYPEVAGGKTALDFFRESKARSRDLQVWVGELYGEFHRGTYTSQAANKRGNRFSEFLLRDAEYLAAFTEGFPRAYPAAKLEEAWKLVLLNQFHDIIPGSSVREVYIDSARDYRKIAELGDEVLRQSLTSIASKLDTASMTRPVALFQNCVTTTQGEIPWSEPLVPQSLVCADEVLPVQLVEGLGERKLVFQAPVACMESVAVGNLSDVAPAQKARLKASSRKIESAEWSVRFDGNGNIVSIESLEDGTEFVEQGKLANLFQLLEDKPLFWSAWDVDIYAQETATDLVKSESFEIVERGPVRVAAEVVKRFGNSTIRQRISLGPTPGIRFDTEVDWHEEDKMLKVAFPVNVNSPRATYEIQFGNLERPTHMNTMWDLAKFEVCAQKWIDLSEGDQGVALLNDCKYGHDVHGNVMRQTLLKAPKAPDPEADMGFHRFTYVLLPHYGPYNYAGIVQAAYALNAPLRHAFLTPRAGVSGTLPPFVHCDERNIVIETVKKSEEGNDLIVRVYECHNSRGTGELSCLREPVAAFLCDLEENPIAELEISDGMIRFDYKPFEIITIRIRV